MKILMCLFLVTFRMDEFAFVSVRPALGLKLCSDGWFLFFFFTASRQTLFALMYLQLLLKFVVATSQRHAVTLRRHL